MFTLLNFITLCTFFSVLFILSILSILIFFFSLIRWILLLLLLLLFFISVHFEHFCWTVCAPFIVFLLILLLLLLFNMMMLNEWKVEYINEKEKNRISMMNVLVIHSTHALYITIIWYFQSVVYKYSLTIFHYNQ